MNDSTLSAEDEIRRRAKKRVGMKLGFYTHLLIFVCVNLGLFAINAARGGPVWHVWPLAGWGLGLAIHGLVAFIGLNGEGVRERMLAQEIDRLKGRR